MKLIRPSDDAVTEVQRAGVWRPLLVTGDGFWSSSLRRLVGRRAAVVSIVAIVVFGILALVAPLFISGSPDETDLSNSFAGISSAHLLGTDELGRDVLTRLLYGTRISLGVSLAGVVIAVVVGTAVGLIAGYFGGWVDEILMRIVDMLLAIPPLFLFILLGILIRPGVITLGAIIAFIFWTSTARLVRGEVMSIKKRDYILAARVLGVHSNRLLFKHILPNVLAVVVVTASLAMAQIILVEASLDFLGLGIRPPTPSLGNMLSNAQDYFTTSPLLVLVPGGVIFILVLAANILGNEMRDAFDPRLHR